jgi:hypothetical protein
MCYTFHPFVNTKHRGSHTVLSSPLTLLALLLTHIRLLDDLFVVTAAVVTSVVLILVTVTLVVAVLVPISAILLAGNQAEGVLVVIVCMQQQYGTNMFASKHTSVGHLNCLVAFVLHCSFQAYNR